jgi:molybdenum cofactor cytidylyltransferase
MGSESYALQRGDAHVAVLLAAGGSTRLGRPKQLLTREGEALVRRAARLLLDTGPHALFVVLGAQASTVSAALAGLPHRALVNDAFASGMASSLRLAAAAVQGSSRPVLISTCDQPGIELAHLETLLAAARTSPIGCAAASYGERCGIPAAVRADAFQRCSTLSGDRGLGNWLNTQADLLRIELGEARLDIDTQADVERARAAGWLDPAS